MDGLRFLDCYCWLPLGIFWSYGTKNTWKRQRLSGTHWRVPGDVRIASGSGDGEAAASGGAWAY